MEGPHTRLSQVAHAWPLGAVSGALLGALLAWISASSPQPTPVIGPVVGQNVLAAVLVGIVAGALLGALLSALAATFVREPAEVTPQPSNHEGEEVGHAVLVPVEPRAAGAPEVVPEKDFEVPALPTEAGGATSADAQPIHSPLMTEDAGPGSTEALAGDLTQTTAEAISVTPHQLDETIIEQEPDEGAEPGAPVEPPSPSSSPAAQPTPRPKPRRRRISPGP